MSYYHWAQEPVRLKRISYTQSGHPKPNGLWFDVDGSWRQWCRSVEFRLERLRVRHNVKILDDSRILFLRNARDIDRFARKYGRNMSDRIRPLQNPDEIEAFSRGYGRDLFSEIREQFSNYIMWGDVAEKYSGIIVNPYSRSRSRKYLWYHGWNCAGGCIWDLGVIQLGKALRAGQCL